MVRINAGNSQGFILAPTFFLVKEISWNTLMIFQTVSSIMLSVLMILLSSLNSIRFLICHNSSRWLLNLNLIIETLWINTGSDLLISMFWNFKLFHLIVYITLLLLIGISMGPNPDEK